MEKLTNIIEAVLFAAGNSIPMALLAEKLEVSLPQVKKSLEELKAKYADDCGIHLLMFNGKVQLASNPEYKDGVADMLNSIKEKEFTKTILESAAIIAYKQPITKGELEDIRRVNSDYAVKTLLDLKMIEPCGRKDAIGKPILYITTDNFLKRFKISSLDELPDYDELMSQIATLSGDAEESAYLYTKDVYEDGEGIFAQPSVDEAAVSKNVEEPQQDDNSDLPDFLKDIADDIIRIE